MRPLEHFLFCPRCAAPRPERVDANCIRCAACGFRYYFNPAVAVAGILRDPQGRVLLIRRAKEPSKGLLGMPGGFIDFDEPAEAALAREIREEVGLELGPPAYLGSWPNHYLAGGVEYVVLDLFFTAPVVGSLSPVNQLEEVESAAWHEPRDIRADDLAFVSMKRAWAAYLERLAQSPFEILAR